MSELDVYSDSDWLDISSGRDSDDNDSLSDQDSDRDGISSVPRSRRSSFSNESSIGGDVEAWEGFVSDGLEEVADVLSGMYPVTLPSAHAERTAVGFVPNPAEAIDPAVAEEDKRVKEALDQSFVGTLNSSRISAAGLHNSSSPTSVRDLRLSFPDPLTSSRDELNRSYEAVRSPSRSSTDVMSEDEMASTEPVQPLIPSFPLLDPGSLSITPEVQRQEGLELEGERKSQLDIILYGTSSEIKWKFVQELIQRAIVASGHDIMNTLQEGESVQTLRIIKKSDTHATFFEAINVFDRTTDSLLKVEIDSDNSDRRSLAIVYVPTAKLPVLSWHSAFIPVLVPSAPNTDGDNTVMRQAAEDDWDLLAVPAKRTLRLGSGDSLVFSSEELSDIKPSRVFDLLRDIGQEHKNDSASKPLTEKIKSVNAVTIFGLVSIIVGFAFNTVLRPPTPSPTPTVNSPSSSSGQLWGIIAPQPNRSVIGSSSAFSSKGPGVTSSSFEALALSVYDARTTSISVASPPSSMSLIVASSSKAVAEVTSTSPMSKYADCTTSNGSKQPTRKVSTDVIVRSSAPTSLSEIPRVKTSLAVVPSKSIIASGSSMILSGTSIAAASSAAANLNFNSVSDVLDATTKALSEVVGTDLSELVEAADELLASLVVQTDNIVRQSKGKARALGEQIQNLNEEVISRNERAKKRAKELKKKGEDIVRGAREELKERTERARKRARQLKQTVVESGNEAWKTYGKAQEEWEGALKSKAGRSQDRQEKKERTKGKKAQKENRKYARTEEKVRRRADNNWRGFRARQD